MKKNALILGLVTFMSLPAFCACDLGLTSSSAITSSSSEEVLTETQKLDKMLNNLRKGVKFTGKVDQTVTFLTGEGGKKTDNIVNNTYLPEIVYESTGRNAFGSTIYQVLGEDETDKTLVFDNQFFEGEDGNTYYYDLCYDNTIKAYPLLDNITKQPINFYYSYANPFSYILPEDLIKVEGKDNTYTMNNAKSTFFSACVLSDIDTAFANIVKSVEFVIEDYELKSITVVPAVEESYIVDYETWATSYYEIEQIATLTVSDIGTAKIRVPETLEVKDEHAPLQNALSKFEGDNYTLSFEVTLSRDSTVTTATYTYYFDGKSLYLSVSDDQSAPSASDILFYQYEGEEFLTPLAYDAESGKFTKDANPDLAAIESSLTYDDLTPEVSDVSAALFNYQSFRKTYEADSVIVNRIAELAFVPVLNPVSNYLGYTIKFLARVGSDGNLENISFSFYNEGFYTIEGKCNLYYSNIGTTVLPHNLEVE